MDTRYPTSLEFLGNELVMNVMVGSQVDFCWRLLSENGSLLVGKTVYVYWNGLPNPLQNSTNSSGIATYRWIPAENCTFWFSAVYYGNFYDIYRDSNEAKHVAYANLIPTSILFDIQPREFRPDTDITLTATVYNMVTNETLPNQTVKFYRFDDSNNSTLIDEDSTDGSGNASISWHYPASGVYAFSANVSGSDHLITSPVSLTVWQNETTLDVNPYVEDYTGEGAADLIALSVYLHCGDVPLAYRNVSVHLMEYNCTNDWETDYSGCASCLGLFFYGPVSQPFSAGFEVSFEGEGCRCASAYDFAPNMTQYTVCTTIQYSYKPSSNSTTITITPTAEDIERQTRRLEEMEQEARNDNWISEWHEFILSYPWYRLHVICAPLGTKQFDVGLSLLPFADTFEPTEIFNKLMSDFLPKVIFGIAYGIMIAEQIAFIASEFGFLGFLTALTISFSTKLLALAKNWDSVEGLISALVGSLFTTAFGLLKSGFSVLQNIIDLAKQVASLAELGFGKLYSIFSLIMNMCYQIRIFHRLIELGVKLG